MLLQTRVQFEGPDLPLTTQCVRQFLRVVVVVVVFTGWNRESTRKHLIGMTGMQL